MSGHHDTPVNVLSTQNGWRLAMSKRSGPALAVLVVALGTVAACGGPPATRPSVGSPSASTSPTGPASASLVPREVPSGDAVIDHAGAWVDPDNFVVNDAGDVLAFVVAFGVIPDDRCEITAPSALLWQGDDGTRRAIGGDVVGRDFVAVPGGGFVVGALKSRCAPSSGQHDAPGAYLVTPEGATAQLRWPAGEAGRRTRRACAATPSDDRCVFSTADGTVHLTPLPTAPDGNKAVRGPGGVFTARSRDGRTLWWSIDGGTNWSRRTTSLAGGVRPHQTVSSLVVAGNSDAVVLGFFTESQVEYSLDSGRTWTVRALPDAPAGFGTYREIWVTGSGTLLARVASQDRRSEALVRATDDHWTHVEMTPARAPLLPLWVVVHGEVVNATNPDVTDASNAGPWWISTDAGATWRRNDLLPVTTSAS